jgi:DNA-binding IclR family transcriptional regulator
MSTIAVQRALIILQYIASSSDGVGVRELARALGYSPAAVQKILEALVSKEFAQQDPLTKQYYLGPGALQVGLAGLTKLELGEVARPILRRLAEVSGETALLGIRHGDEVVYIDKALSPAEIRLDAPLGVPRPFNCTAIGKVLLSYLPEGELERLAQAGAFVQATPHSVVGVNRLRSEIVRVRERGFAIDREEFSLGAMCLAAPVRNHNQIVVAAIAVAGPVQRVEIAEKELARQVITCTNDVSTGLGYQESAAITHR